MAEINEIVSKQALQSILDTDKAIVSLDAAMIKLLADIEKGQTTLKENKVNFDNLEKAQKEITKTTKGVDKIGKQLADTEKKLIDIEDARTKEIIKNRSQITERNKELKDEITINEKNVGTLKKLRAENRLLTRERENLNLATEEGVERLAEINSALDENNELLKSNTDQLGQQRLNIGNYEESIKSALDGTNAFSGGVGGVTNNFIEISQQEGGVKRFFATFVTGIKGATKAALKFIATPIGAIIAAIVVGIGLFTAAIKRNEGASDGFIKIWKGITNVIQEVIGRVFKLVGVIGKLFKGNFKGAAKQAKEAIVGVGKAMNDAFKEGSKLFELQKKLAESNIITTKSIALLNAEAEKQQTIADNATLSFAKRERAAQAARVAQIESARLGLSTAQQELAIIDLRVDKAVRQGKINRELRQEQADAVAKVTQEEGTLTQVLIENDKIRGELKQDRLEKDLDILIDGFDNVKTINEKILQDESKSFDERQKILDNLVVLSDNSFAKQIETLRQFTKISFDENQLLAEQDAVILNEKIRGLGLSEIIEGRLLEVIRERRIVLQDLADAERDFNTKKQEQIAATLKLEQDAIDALQGSEKDFDDWLLAQEQKLQDGLKAIRDKALQDKLDAEKEANDEALAREKQKRIAQVEIAAIAGDAALGVYMNRLDAESMALDIQKEQQLKIAGDNEEAREAVEEKFAKKQRELSLKLAKAEKLAALFNIAINTAVAIMKITAQTGVAAPLAIPLAIAAGVANAALVLSQPLPQLAEGTKGLYNTPDSFIAGEKGTELVKTRSGKTTLVKEETLFTNAAGMRVYSNPELQKLMAGGQVGFDSPGLKAMHQDLHNDLHEVKKAILGKPTFIMDRDRNVFAVKTRSHVTRLINKTRYGQ